MYFSKEILQPYIDEGWVSEQIHPEAPHISIVNYTNRTQYAQHWDDITRRCRGLVLNHNTKEVMAACLPKFHNYEEHVANSWNIPNEMPIVTEKYDGWYGSLYWLDAVPRIATRGSFTSPGALWATEWFRKTYWAMTIEQREYWRNPDVTHIFEIVSPITRIVVKYDFQGLVHLATLDRHTGKDWWPLHPMGHATGIRQAKVICADDYQTLREEENDGAEGFVCLFPQSGIRIKLKFAEYVRRHKIYTGLSAHTLWLTRRDGEPEEQIIMNAPDELQPWIHKKLLDFDALVKNYDRKMQNLYSMIMRDELSRSWGNDKTKRDKEIALKFQEHPEEQAFLFVLHKYRDMMWKKFEPKEHETFRDDEGE